jgi:hypothetical protein
MWDMRIGPYWVYVAHGTLGVGEILLSDEYEWLGRHSAAINCALSCGDLREVTSDMNGPCSPGWLGGPGDAAFNCEIYLIGGWAIAKALISARKSRRESISEHVGQHGWSHVPHCHASSRQVLSRSDPHSGLNLPTELEKQRGERISNAS